MGLFAFFSVMLFMYFCSAPAMFFEWRRARRQAFEQCEYQRLTSVSPALAYLSRGDISDAETANWLNLLKIEERALAVRLLVVDFTTLEKKDKGWMARALLIRKKPHAHEPDVVLERFEACEDMLRYFESDNYKPGALCETKRPSTVNEPVIVCSFICCYTALAVGLFVITILLLADTGAFVRNLNHGNVMTDEEREQWRRERLNDEWKEKRLQADKMREQREQQFFEAYNKALSGR